MLVGRCSSQLSGHQNHERNQKSNNLRGICSFGDLCWKRGILYSTKLSSRPERTRISCHAALDKTACALLLGGLGGLGLVVQGVDDFSWLGIAEDDPCLVLDCVRVGLQVLHVVLQAAILLLQAQYLLLEHLVLMALLLISR